MGKKIQKTPRRQPRVLTIIACDGASRDPNSGKATLYGVFDNINAPELPTVAVFSVYVKLIDGAGKWAFQIDFVDPKGKSTALASPTAETECAPGKRSEIAILGLPCKLTREGVHKLRVNVNGKPLNQEYEITVVLKPKVTS